MVWYTPVQPPAPLTRVLACSWTAKPSGTHRLVPDACVDLLWTSNAAIVLCGPETTAWDFTLPAGTTAVGVRFRPGTVTAVFDVDVSTLRDRRVPLDAIAGRPAADALRAAIDAAEGPQGRMHCLERFVDERLRLRLGSASTRTAGTGSAGVDPWAERVLETLATAPRASAGELAAHLGTTTRQLHRRSLASFGYGTSVLARLLRFQRFVSLADAAHCGRRSLAAIAVEAGYSDQAHLTRDCRAITGNAPTAFLRDVFATFPDMSDPYKTDGVFIATMAG